MLKTQRDDSRVKAVPGMLITHNNREARCIQMFVETGSNQSLVLEISAAGAAQFARTFACVFTMHETILA